jgi:hypothetical protein
MEHVTETLKRWYEAGAGRRIARVSAVTVLALVLYLVGLKFLLLPVLVAANARLLPLPAVFKSFASRLVMGGLVTAVLLQVAATAQFLAFPGSDFQMLALLGVLLHGVAWLIAPVRTQPEIMPWVTRHDLFALIVAGFFLLPFVPFIGRGGMDSIARMGGSQAIDSTNHFAGIAEMTEAQHLTYKPGYYYPKGFHITQGFTQNTFFGKQYDLGWRGNAVLFFGHYVLMGTLLAYTLYYLALAFFRMLRTKLDDALEARAGLWLALTLGPTAALVYLVPFVTEGFLNYYYVIATIVAGLIVLLSLYEQKRKSDELPKLVTSTDVRWGLFLYLLLVFGASASWPLLIPPLVGIAIWCVLPANLSVKALFVNTIHWRTLAVIAVFLLQLVPVYFQLQYSGSDGSQGINLTGGLKAFHPYVLLVGFLLVMGLVLSRDVSEALKRALMSIFMPLAAFTGILVAFQYYSIGEIRYYVIKTSLLLEILLLVIACAWLVYRYFDTTAAFARKYALLLPLVPFVVVIILIGSAANPMKDLRDLFRVGSGQAAPAFLRQDAEQYVRLGSEGKIKHFNSTTLHYNSDQDKLFTHMQLPFWGNMMQYNSSDHDFRALHCIGALYSNLAFGNYTPAEQAALIAKLKECARHARENRQDFYIITDKSSVPMIRSTFGDLVKIVY